MQVEHLLSVGNQLGEGPVWIAEESSLYWVDIYGKAYYRYQPETGSLHKTDLPVISSFMLFGEDGEILVGTPDGLAVWEPSTGQLRLLSDNVAFKPDGRFNDADVDPAGRVWAGTMSSTQTNHLYCIDLDGRVTVKADGLGIANGIGWTADSRTMYHVDSSRDTIYRYDFDATTGGISNREIFFQPPKGFGTPDGFTMDVNDNLWCAFWDGWKVACITPSGDVETIIEMPVQRATSCTFGGKNGDELFITSAIDNLSAEALHDQPYAGDLFRVKLPVKGQMQRRFSVKGLR